jgi:hypothetical protein
MVKRYKVVYVTTDLIQMALTQGYTSPPIEVVEGLPEGAELVHTWYETTNGRIALLFRHDSFAPVQDGTVPPVLSARVRRLPNGPAPTPTGGWVVPPVGWHDAPQIVPTVFVYSGELQPLPLDPDDHRTTEE